ncbi:MAG: PAS domain-containing protein, partial [Bacteroidales bacterium]|nr:PAS domain-containing protein [Bacteroidales bacterium]
EIWDRLSSGGQHHEGYMRHITKMGLELWTMSTYTCVRKDDGTIDRVLFLAVDSTEQKQESLYFEGQIKAINNLNPKAEFSPDGKIHYFNDLFLKTLKFKEADVKNKNIFDFIAHSDQESINEIWEQVIAGHAYQGQLRMLGKYEEEVWFRAAFSVVEDMYGEVDKVVFLAYENTKEKELEILMLERNEKLKEKEDEMRLQSIDLKRQINELNASWENEKNRLHREVKKYSDILDSHPTPILAVNNQGFVIIFNKAAVKLLKISKKAILNKTIDLLFSYTQSHEALMAFISPKKQIVELNSELVEINLANESKIEKTISIFENELGSEVISTMIIHS